MGMTALRQFDPRTLFTSGNYPANGFWLQPWGNSAGSIKAGFYYDRLDVMFAIGQRAGGYRQYIRFDPLLLSNTGSLFDDVPLPPQMGGANAENMALGEWDKALNVQKLYHFKNAPVAADGVDEINPVALASTLAVDPYPLVGVHTSRVPGILTTTPGYYTVPAPGGTRWQFFESWGFALCSRATLRHTDGVSYVGVPVLVDLATGLASLVNTPVSYGTVTHKFAGPELFAQQVDFNNLQFVADDASIPTQPVGQVIFFAPPGDNPGDATLDRLWIKVIDWNPLGVDSTPLRVHLRTRFISAFDLLESTPAALNGIFSTQQLQGGTFYHPRQNKVLFYDGTADGLTLDPAESKFIEFSFTPAFSYLTEPFAYEEIASGKTVQFGAEARGSLGEIISGKNVSFQLRRVSTVKETLATTGTPGETVTLANAVSPTDPVVSPISVYENGILLAETTHYTLNRAASQITFVAPKPLAGAVYQATYRHFGTPATPPHGELLSAAAQTGVEGVALTRVRYDEEASIPDRWDRLDADPV